MSYTPGPRTTPLTGRHTTFQSNMSMSSTGMTPSSYGVGTPQQSTTRGFYTSPSLSTPTTSYGVHQGGGGSGQGTPVPPSVSMPQRLEQTYIRPPPSQQPSSSGSGLNVSSPQAVQSTGGSPDPEVIDHASKTLDRLMNRDLQFPTVYKSLTTDPTQAVSGSRPVSGFMDYDYPPYVQRHMVTEKQFSKIHSAPVPPELNEMLNQVDIRYCHMGLFPEIYRAWMTIDSDIYLWDFRDGSDLSFFDGLTEPIIMIQLVPAKTKVFQSSIKHLLCVTTLSEIVILGFVVIEPGPVIELVPQPIFVIPSEGVTFSVIHGTKDGRIFLGGKDGSVHEVSYQAEKGWMTDRCWKTNLTRSYLASIFKFISSSAALDPIVEIVSDDVRNLLFTRSQSGALQVFDLGQDGAGFTRVGYLTFDGIVNEVLTISKKTLESNIVKKILTIAPLTSGEMNLVAVLDNGTRLYFSCYQPPTGAVRAPNHFHLVHVRMPPGHCTATVLPKPAPAHTSLISSGIFTLASKSSHNNDSFWLISPFMYPGVCYSEVFSIIPLSGHAMDIKLIPTSDSVLSNVGLDQLPDAITQHLDWHRDVVVLTSNGTSVFRAHKPYEVLKNLLLEFGAADGVRYHFEGGIAKEQPLANAVLLSVHPSTRSEPSVLDLAVKSYFCHGTDASRGWTDGRMSSPFENTMDFNPNIVSTPRQESSIAQQQSPFAQQYGVRTESGYVSPPSHVTSAQSPYGTPPAMGGQEYPVTFSARHDAIYLVAGRVLFHFWNRPLVNTSSVGKSVPPIITPNVHGSEVTHAVSFIQNIIRFINSNPSLFMTRNISAAVLNLNTPEARQFYAEEMEKNSIVALRDFLLLTLEVLNMWKILCDHQFHIVLHGVDNQLQNSTMRDLVTAGHNTVSVIINALISKYLGDNAAVDAISMRLREVCPSLFKSEDAIGSKVAEILGKVKNCADPQEKELLLKESLSLAEKICGHGRVNIRNLCKQYSDLGFPVGAVRLCVSAAKTADPEKLAFETVKGGPTSADPVAIQAFQTRAEIYRIVFDLLDNYVQIASTSQSPILRMTEDRLTPESAQLCIEETVHAVLTSDDEMFHISLYNWLLEKKQFDRLLEIKHPYLDAFLQRAADAVVSGKWTGGGGISANDTRVLDLLWRHHEMNQNHSAAAHILARLAESTTTGLNLQQRLEYLSRAIVCSKMCTYRSDVLEALEDKTEVAQIQKNILDSINTKINSRLQTGGDDAEVKLLQEAALKLNSQLLAITPLYTDFAHPLKLNEAKLQIFYAAGHADKQNIEAVWSDIIEEELAANPTSSSEVQMDLIRRKIVSIGRKYRGSPTFFPLEYLIEHLESMKPNDTDNIAWVFETMLEVGISFSDMLSIYEGLWRRALNRSSSSPDGDVAISKVILLMINSVTRQEADVRATFTHRLDILEKCKDLISAMVVEFSSRFDPSSTEMMPMLNRVRDRLDRISVFI